MDNNYLDHNHITGASLLFTGSSYYLDHNHCHYSCPSASVFRLHSWSMSIRFHIRFLDQDIITSL